MPRLRGAKALENYFAKVLAPEATRELPVYRPNLRDPEERLWSRDFVLFAVRRAWGFSVESVLQGGRRGTDLVAPKSAKGAVRSIDPRWHTVESVVVEDRLSKEGDQGSRWTIEFGATWDRRGGRQAGSKLSFRVDRTGWALLEEFRSKDGSARDDWPDSMDPSLDRQKRWEGWQIFNTMFDRNYTRDDLIAALLKGGNPFFGYSGKMIGQFPEDGAEIRALMDRVRQACAPELGFHRRLAPHLTEAGLRALASQGQLDSAAPAPVSRSAG